MDLYLTIFKYSLIIHKPLIFIANIFKPTNDLISGKKLEILYINGVEFRASNNLISEYCNFY